ncbi:hypothetical protein [Streptomyces solaniscabiei]|uniref:hypothetical protein n=1 Tax=Streptomyces solaniscabiei TaxID=2683255 RepID=UPI001CE353A4|nr:hypothetical protein [Streptomyces solaniscabiei]
MTLAPSTFEDTIEKNINTVAQRLGIQVRSALPGGTSTPPPSPTVSPGAGLRKTQQRH